MSDETARILGQARVAVQQRQAEADAERQKCLEAVATALPARVDAAARAVAHDQGDVTTQLAPERVKALRGDLRAAADTIAERLRHARSEVDWLARTSTFDDVPRKVSMALWFYLRESTDQLAKVMAQYGYSDKHEGKSTQRIFSPGDLLEKGDTAEVAGAQERLYDALDALRAAEADHATSTVNDLWDA